jgi:hypothetical protein
MTYYYINNELNNFSNSRTSIYLKSGFLEFILLNQLIVNSMKLKE